MKKVLILSLILVLAISFASPIFAAEEKAKKSNPIASFFRGLFRFPAKVTEKSVGVGTETTKKAVGIGTKEVENVGGLVTGKPEKVKDIVMDPLKGTADTTVEASKIAIVPIEAAKESFPAEEKEEAK